MSNPTLWPSMVSSPSHVRNCGRTVSMVGAFSTISLVIPVMAVTMPGIGISGLMSCVYFSMMVLFLTFAAPISMISFQVEDSPVVSRSTQV